MGNVHDITYVIYDDIHIKKNFRQKIINLTRETDSAPDLHVLTLAAAPPAAQTLWKERPQTPRSALTPVDSCLSASVRRGVLLTKDTDASRPPAARQRHMPGASPTGKDTERLVPNVQPRAHNAPDAPCPTCGLDGEGTLRPAVRMGVIYADYLCPAGHIWATHWPSATTGRTS